MSLPVVADFATCAKATGNLTGDLILNKPVTTDSYFGIFFIQGLPFVKEFSKSLMSSLGNAPRSEVADSALNFRKRNLKKNDGRYIKQMVHGLVTVSGTAAGGNNMVGDVQFENLILLDGTQVEMIVFVHDLLQRFLLIDLDQDVGVNKTKRQIFGEDNPDGAFARTRHADQGEICFHGTGFPFGG
jgi:hypothetical protein